jgi:hypothetical protein
MLCLTLRQLDGCLISPLAPHFARRKWRKIVPRASRTERFFKFVKLALTSA